MKKLIPLLFIIALSSCKKDGYMYVAYHRIKYDHNRNCSDFFAYPEKNEAAALKFYNETRPWDSAMIEIDSTWVKYYCTESEWRRK